MIARPRTIWSWSSAVATASFVAMIWINAQPRLKDFAIVPLHRPHGVPIEPFEGTVHLTVNVWEMGWPLPFWSFYELNERRIGDIDRGALTLDIAIVYAVTALSFFVAHRLCNSICRRNVVKSR